jgi:carboxypeptidase C (cathepsin A)
VGQDGKVIASVFYVFYERTDIRDRSARPFVISFNGGPGSSSVWMHVGYTGPRHLEIDAEGHPVQPYGIRENPHSILDVADIVYVDPVNTGFSRIVGDADRAQFFGVNEDVEYLARWIDTFVTRHDRWRSPKFLIGESYGTTRVSGLAARLQSAHWMYLNGVILVSPTGLGINRQGPVAAALPLPYYAATAWYHKVLPTDLQSLDLDELLPQVEKWTIDQYIPALAQGGFLDEGRRSEVARTVARYSGLSEQLVLNNNLAVATSLFWKDLLRDKKLTIGRLDSSYRGIDRDDGGITLRLRPGDGTRGTTRSRRPSTITCGRCSITIPTFSTGLRPGQPLEQDRRHHGREPETGDGREPVPAPHGAVGLLRWWHRLLLGEVHDVEHRSERKAT